MEAEFCRLLSTTLAESTMPEARGDTRSREKEKRREWSREAKQGTHG
jgi:hypothetical protein